MSTVKQVVVQGASGGLGLALCKNLLEGGARVAATCRHPERSRPLLALRENHSGLRLVPLDLTEESSVADAARVILAATPRLDMLINTAGLLHSESLSPEKKLDHVSLQALHQVFAVNAFGPLLMARHFGKALCHDGPAVLANISARVGSIDDNRLGGWYAYRGSKAALNMFTRTTAIELGRRSKKLVVVSIHPGTVDTALSRPFQRNVPPQKLFTREFAAASILKTLGGLGPGDSGSFFAYDGSPIAW